MQRFANTPISLIITRVGMLESLGLHLASEPTVPPPSASPPRWRRAPSLYSRAREGRCLRAGARLGRAGSARWRGVSRRVVRPADTGGWWLLRRRFAHLYLERPPEPGPAPPRFP